MKMGVKVYYSEISGNKEVKKHQQRVMMILDSKLIPYESIDITEAGKEAEKEFMIKNGKPRGDSKYVLSPQIFNEEVYCGDYEDFDVANENDVLETFLHTTKVERQFSLNGTQQNGTVGSREGSTEAEAKVETKTELKSEETEVQPSTTKTEPEELATAEAPLPVTESVTELSDHPEPTAAEKDTEDNAEDAKIEKTAE